MMIEHSLQNSSRELVSRTSTRAAETLLSSFAVEPIPLFKSKDFTIAGFQECIDNGASGGAVPTNNSENMRPTHCSTPKDAVAVCFQPPELIRTFANRLEVQVNWSGIFRLWANQSAVSKLLKTMRSPPKNSCDGEGWGKRFLGQANPMKK